MRRIVFISTMEGCPWGGSEELWSQAAMKMAQNGTQVSACVGHWDGPRPALARLHQAGVTMHLRCAMGARLWERAWRKLIQRSVPGLLNRRDSVWLSRQNADLVCISQGGIADGLAWMLHCRNVGIPYAVIAHANAEWLWPDDQNSELMALAYLSARMCCFVSQKNRELFEDQIAQKLRNAVVVRNPCNVRYNARPPWPEPVPDWRLACVARLDPLAKGQDLLLRILAQEKWKHRNLRVSFYGTGRCERNLRTLAARFSLTQVDFVGHVGDVEKIWSENQALVLASRYEGTPLALVEAMLCSRPAIVTDVAGNSELVEHGVSGFVARAPSVSLLDEAIEEAWERRSEWKKMGSAARERVTSLVPADPVGHFCDRLVELGKDTK